MSHGTQVTQGAFLSAEKSQEKDSVSFKPVLGIRPGIYLSIAYAAVFLLILFFLFVFPGLKNPHSRISFTSEPWGSAVRMDDVYIGTTPFLFDVPSGVHQFTFVLPGFEEKKTDIEIKGRIFASLFFPKRMKMHQTIETSGQVNAFVLGAQSFADWSFAGASTAVYQHPMDLSKAAYRIGFVPNPDDRLMTQEILKASVRFAATKTAARDVIRGKFLLDNAGKAASPLSALSSMKDMVQYLAHTEGSSFWLASLLPDEAVSELIESSWYWEEAQSSAQNNVPLTFAVHDNSVTRVKNLVFRKIPVNNASLYNEEFNGDFWLCESLITEADWDVFIDENPKWSANNINALVREELVTDAYLQPINDSRYPLSVVPGISWFAAKAYCDWLSASLDASFAGYAVRLPAEDEWEYAVSYNKEVMEKNGRGLQMIGSFWEWCEDPFTPLHTFPALPEAVNTVSSPKRSVRGGGSWYDSRRSSSLQTRGSLEAKSSSPFVSFRPILVINKENSP